MHRMNLEPLHDMEQMQVSKSYLDGARGHKLEGYLARLVYTRPRRFGRALCER